jgi:hypothetical protein
MFIYFIGYRATVGHSQARHLIPDLFNNYFQLYTLYGIKGKQGGEDP